MRGPKTDIDNILSGLKTRTIDIHPPAPVAAQMSSAMSDTMSDYGMNDDSVISVTSLRDMQNTNMPKRSRKRNNGSNRNTISLDI